MYLNLISPSKFAFEMLKILHPFAFKMLRFGNCEATLIGKYSDFEDKSKSISAIVSLATPLVTVKVVF